jgi:phosphate/sulfate permease
MLERRRSPLRTGWCTVLAGAPLAAHAHGQAVLTVVYAQAVVVAVCLLLAWWVPPLRAARWLAALGCAAGVVVAWVWVLDLPRQSHAAETMAWMVLSPLLGAAVAVFWAWVRRGRHGR